MIETIAIVGGEPVTDASPVPIAVTIDTGLVPVTQSAVHCGAGVSRQFCGALGGVRPQPSGSHAGSGVMLRFAGETIQPEVLMIEIVRLSASTLGARGFVYSEPDADISTPPSCELAQTPRPPLRIEGSMVLSSADLSMIASLHGRASLTVNGAPFSIDF